MIKLILVELNRVEQFLFDSTCSVSFELRVDFTDSAVHQIDCYSSKSSIADILSNDLVEMISRSQITGLAYTLFILLNQFTLLRAESLQRVRAARDAAEGLRVGQAEEELNETLDEQKEA